ncbi:MAG: hypothetical protein CVV23_13430 [Ignavibacteriae bacterium HGW-Ignavibacteriae-2]|jgi:glycosyltransferase involved in cell wall biosynthesis|nr:glycosyltransferase family 4 protein [Bacteroidota bacterium]PKL87814.1 MAG: hypothetical protein CVV23_13430 [Ignavibacteriae bacterium HGW-Ignavibacteriae-2]
MNFKKSVCIAFLGNAFNDTRVTNLVDSLTKEGFEVRVISFDWTSENFTGKDGNIAVFKLDKTNSHIKYYLNFIKILFTQLRKTNCDYYVASDVYTLPLVTFFAKFKKKKIYYDCRELYPFLAGLRNRKYLQIAIRFIERVFISKVDKVIATAPMDAQFIQHYYKITDPIVLRNLPKIKKCTESINLRGKLNIPENSKILLYQGVIFEGRGIGKTISALPKLEDAHFIVIGSGNKRKEYEKLAIDLGVEDRVHFIGTKSQEELINYTTEADYGLSLIENISLSYYYALPNKMFEYIAAGVPVICSALPQMKDIVDDYKVGWVLDIENGNVASAIEKIMKEAPDKNTMKNVLEKASAELNWDVEFEKIKGKLFT